MRYFKYFIQFLFAIVFFIICKLLGPKISSELGGRIFEKIGPYFRSKKLIHTNIKNSIPNVSSNNLNTIIKLMWNNYGRVFAEYMFIKNFRMGKLSSKIEVEGQEILDDIKKYNKQVIFVSGHFGNFELMAMHLEKTGINLSTIYRPLNNIFLNFLMERIRKKYICKHQIKKGIGGMKKLLNLKKNNISTALMIDQRVSEGILSNFFNKKALTTTVPAQLVKKFNIPVIPIYLERIKDINFKIIINKPLFFSKNDTIQNITDKLNKELEKMILNKPEQWIWSHNRWK